MLFLKLSADHETSTWQITSEASSALSNLLRYAVARDDDDDDYWHP